MLAKIVKHILTKPVMKVEDALKPTAGLKKTEPHGLTYARVHRGQWFKPEYNFQTLQIAQQSDGILLRTIKKKADRVMLAGYEFVSKNTEPLDYIKTRIKQMEMVSNKPFSILIRQTVEDLVRQNNCMWEKIRSIDSSSGEVRKDMSGKMLLPVAAYSILPFETLEFKTKMTGESKKIRQVFQNDSGETREFSASDVIHFYTDMKAGYMVGTPELLPALDDIALLRRMEDNIEDLVETNLFPVFHYRVGTDTMPEVHATGGKTESQMVKDSLEYMPPGSVYVTDHRHEISALGSEGKALKAEGYLDYFKKRAIASAGSTEVDLGMDGSSSRSTANTLSKSMTMDIEAIQRVMETFINFYIINELLLEGGFDPSNDEDEVRIRFGTVDLEQRIALENNQSQLFTQGVRTLTEVRHSIGDPPMKEEDYDLTYAKLYGEPLALSKSMQPGNTAEETLATIPTSNVTPEAVSKGKRNAEKQAKVAAATKAVGKKPSGGSKGAAKKGQAKARPSNQHGVRSSPKLNKDINISDTIISIPDIQIDDNELDTWIEIVQDRYDVVKASGVSLQTVADSLVYRLKNE